MKKQFAFWLIVSIVLFISCMLMMMALLHCSGEFKMYL